MFANSWESYKLCQPRNLGICYFWIYSVTPLAVQGSEIVVFSKLRKREHENGRKLGRRRAAPTPPPFSFFPVLRSYFRVSFTYASFLLPERLEPESGFIPVILFNWNLNCSDILLIKLCAKDTVHYSPSKTNIPYLNLSCFDWLLGPVYVLSRVEWLPTKPLTYHWRVNISWNSLHNLANRLHYKQNVDERRPQIGAAFTLTTGSRTVASVINHCKRELLLLRWGDVGQMPFCLLGRGNDSQESRIPLMIGVRNPTNDGNPESY